MLLVAISCVLLVAGIHAAPTCHKIKTYRDKWDGGYVGVMMVPVGTSVSHWTGKLTFSHPLTKLDVWSGKVERTEDGQKTFYIKNNDWNANLKAGDQLEVGFVAHYTSSPAGEPCFNFYPNGQPDNSKPPTNTGSDSGSSSGTGSGSNPPVSGPKGKYDYGQALRLSLLFYEAERTGRLPADNRIPWRGNSALNDGRDIGKDLTGGWFDAGDHVKFGLPMSSSATLLLWGVVFMKEGYVKANQYDAALREVKWALDFFLKCQTDDNTFVAQVGDGDADHAYWGRPEDMTMARPTYVVGTSKGKGGADVVGETAASLAAGAVAFAEKDSAYARTLYNAAIRAYNLAKKLPGTYIGIVPNVQKFYNSNSWKDEMAHAAGWIAYAAKHAMGDNAAAAQYQSESASYTGDMLAGGVSWAVDWNEKTMPAALMMYKMTKDAKYKTAIETFMKSWMPGGSVQYTPKGLAWRQEWGANRYSANVAFFALLCAREGINTDTYKTWAGGQIGYMLGDTGFSYLVGFGSRYPQQPHHRAASCPPRNVKAVCGWDDFNADRPNPHVLQGALAGGPDQYDNFLDKRNNFKNTEVTTDYNSGFTGALAALLYYEG